jgi:hypothetical protein
MTTFVGANTPTTAGVLIPLGYQQITLAGVSNLTPPTGATQAVISVSAAPVRYRDDSTAPTATLGVPVLAGATITYSGGLAVIRFIPQSGTPVLDIAYYR